MDEGLLNDLLECSVCLERLDTSSRVLPCQHTFCLQCLREIVYAQKELRCPECRVPVETPVDELPPNVLLMRILEGMRNSGGRKLAPGSSPPRRPNVASESGVGVGVGVNGGVSSHGFTYAGEDGKHTNVIPECTPHARAVFDYPSDEPTDLSFKKGEVIILRRQIDAEWYYGEIGGVRGMFPIAYAKIVVPLPPPAPQCVALYDFRMAAPDEEGCLAFSKGAVIHVIRRVDENWAEGRLHDKIGIFPIAFVEMNPPALAVIGGSSDSQTHHASDPASDANLRNLSGKSSRSSAQKNSTPQRNALAASQFAHRQQAAAAPPVPDVGPSAQRVGPETSQSHPAHAHRRTFRGPRETPSAETSDPHEGALAQMRDLQLDSQNKERSNFQRSSKQSNVRHEASGRSVRTPDSNVQSGDKTKSDGGKLSDLTSSYHSANNLNSDSSSATATLSFSGGSATTAPNTSSSNSASESNSPSSPASPASDANRIKSNISGQSDVPLAINHNYCVSGGRSADASNSSIGEFTADATSTIADASIGNCNSSSVQNVNGNSVNATPPRSNVSSPQICLGNSNIICNTNNAAQSQADGVMMSNNYSVNKNSSSQNVIDSVNQTTNLSNLNPQHNPFLNMTPNNVRSDGKPIFYKMTDQLSNEHNLYNMISPRHGGKDISRLSHAHHHREKEKRHSLTPVGQNLTVLHSSVNRHSAEILGTTSILLDQHSSQDIANTKHSEREKQRTDKEKPEKDYHKSKDHDKEKSKKSSTIDKSFPMTYIALYPYKPQKPDELELKKGGLYMVLEQCQDGWFKGCSSRSKKCGVFPGNYVAPASKNVQLMSASLSKNKQGNSLIGSDLPVSSPSNSKSKESTSSGFSKKNFGEQTMINMQPPDLPPRSQSPGTQQIFAWTSPKCSSSKSSEKKEKLKSEKNSSGVSLMKRLTGMKKSRSPPPCNNSGFSMDNPVFEDCVLDNYTSSTNRDAGQITQSTIPQHPVHIRSGSCPSQLLQGVPVNTINSHSQNFTHCTNESIMIDGGVYGPQLTMGGSVSSAVAHRLFPSYHAMKGIDSQTLSSTHELIQSQRRQPRPTVLNSLIATSDTTTLCPNTVTQGFTGGRTTGDHVLWVPPSTRHHYHRKSHSLDAGQQLRSGKENSNQPVGKRFRCIVAYPPNSEYELELQVNDVVLVHKKLGEGWYKGTLERTGHTGLIPASFVEAC